MSVMSSDSATLSYWLNWRFFLCALWLITSVALSAFLIWKYEGLDESKRGRSNNEEEKVGSVYEDEAWKTCLKGIHPAWLLCYRLIAFLVLMAMLIVNLVYAGGRVFYFYTEWTFTLVIIYFGLASSFSIYGCSLRYNPDGDRANLINSDAEQGSYVAPTINGSADMSKSSETTSIEAYSQQTAGAWGYIFQIIYQMSAGTVMLTDSMFWLVIYPFLTSDDYALNFLIGGMHSIQAVFLLGDALLNCLRFPMFRIAYFFLVTCMFVTLQWIIHACVSLWWPYPFLDLSSPYAPLWYFGIGLMHVPLYGIFALIVRLKQFVLSRYFPESYQSFR